MRDKDRRPSKRYKMKENKKFPYRKSRVLIFKQMKGGYNNGNKKESKEIIKTKDKVAITSKQGLERNEGKEQKC
jgi:hypothetical protein